MSRRQAMTKAASTSASRAQFQKIRRRLWISNLLVFAVLLGGFAIAIRLTFIYNLQQQQREQLRVLARGAMALVEIEEGKLEIDSYEATAQGLTSSIQGVQWFDHQGKLLAQLGSIHPDTTLELATLFQRHAQPERIQSFTLAVVDPESAELEIGEGAPKGSTDLEIPNLTSAGSTAPQQNRSGAPIVYIRASQAMAPLDTTVQQLDWGLGIGVVVALGLSGLGGLWLNRQTMQPIEESFTRLKQFTADASHELRNPIMAISSNAEVALKYSDGMRDDDRETLELIVGAAEQMSYLTQDLLLLARLDKRLAVENQLINLTELLENLVKLYRPQALEKNIQLHTQIQADLQSLGDTTMLIRAFTNLLQNALRYTPAEGKVVVQGTKAAHQIVIAVKDTGIGIANENLEKIFERFWRADKVRYHESGGTGLGLSITQAIIRNHGGDIQVQSQPAKGSCFTVVLPVGLNA